MFNWIYCNISEFILMFDKIIENLVLLIVFGVLIIGTYIMITANYELDRMYFDSPIVETNTDKIA